MCDKIKPKVLSFQHMKKETKKMVYGSALLTGISLTGAVYSTTHLEPEGQINVNHGISLFFMGLLFFTSLYQFCVHVTQKTYWGHKIIKRYKLTTADIFDISNKVVSTVQALFSCLTGAIICSYSCSRNMLKTCHYISHVYAWFGASYFFYDVWSMYTVHLHTPPGQINTPSTQMNTPVPVPNHEGATPTIGFLSKFWRYIKLNPIIVGHHLFIGTFGFLVIVYLKGGLGDCIFGFIYLMEASTPFVSLRSVLSRFQLKSSKLYIWNGFAMLLIFFLCRVAMFPYVMYMYAKAAQLDYITAMKSLPTGCKVSMLILMLPQLYWFYLMVKGATKILREPTGKKRSEL